MLRVMSHHIALICVAIHLLQIIWSNIKKGSKLFRCDHATFALYKLTNL